MVAAIGMAQHAVAVVQITVQFHVANRDQPVEPGVGQRLHHHREAPLGDARPQPCALLGDARRVGLPVDEQDIALLFHRARMRRIQPQQFRLARDGDDEVLAGFGGVGFEVRSIHLLMVLVLCRAALRASSLRQTA